MVVMGRQLGVNVAVVGSVHLPHRVHGGRRRWLRVLRWGESPVEELSGVDETLTGVAALV